jgi:hypothetical protein
MTMQPDRIDALRKQLTPWLRGLLDRPNILNGEFEQTVNEVVRVFAAYLASVIKTLKGEK